MKNYWKLTLFGLLFHMYAFGQWTPLPSGVTSPILDIDFTDADFGVAVGENGNVLFTENGGTTWSNFTIGDRIKTLRSVLAISRDTILTAENSIFDGLVHRTVDGGLSWNVVSTGADLALTQRGILALGYDTLQYSTDRGGDWVVNDLGLGGTLLIDRLHFADEAEGYIIGNISGFISYSAYRFRTVDGGLQWAPLWVFDLPNSNAYTSFSSPSPDTAYLFSNRQVNFLPGPENTLVRMTGFYFDTEQEKNSWRFKGEVVNADLPGLIICSVFLDGQTGYAGSADGIIYATKNGGMDWTPEYMDRDTIFQIKIMENGNIYAVGSNGLILRRSLASNTSKLDPIVSIEAFPNPASDWLYVKGFPVEKAKGYLSNYSGQLIRSFNWRQGDSIDISDLEAGGYLLEFRTNSLRYLTKFQKLN